MLAHFTSEVEDFGVRHFRVRTSNSLYKHSEHLSNEMLYARGDMVVLCMGW